MSKNMLGFVETENENQKRKVKILSCTAKLTETAAEVASNVLDTVESDFENKKALFEMSKTDHSAMDTLIDTTCDLTKVDIGFLKELDEQTLNSSLKSQQSKRSRAKGKTMTMDNYKSMLTAAIAEGLVRLVLNKPRVGYGGFTGRSILDYTPEEIQELAQDQEALRRAIRNVQSHKCIYKAREDFNEADERYQSILKVEAVLKDLRVTAPRVHTDKTKNKLKEMLEGYDIESLKAADSKDLLKQISQLVEADAIITDELAESEVTEDAE